MPGLFDALKEGTFSLFAGPQDPRLAAGTGNREGLIDAGLATIASGNQDPLEAIAIGAQAGRASGAAVREQQLGLQRQAALASFVNEAGFDREGLTSVFFKVLASGDMEGARAVSEILKSLPKDDAPSPVNRQNVGTVVSAAAGAPPEIVAQFGEGTQVEVQRDPRTGEIFWESALPSQPSEETLKTRDRPVDGVMHRFLVDGRGVELQDFGPTGTGATGGQEAQREERILATIDRLTQSAFSAPDASSSVFVGSLAQAAGGTGPVAIMARLGLNIFDPEGDAITAATAAQQLTGQLVALISGATASDRERSFISGAYTIQPGDPEAAIRAKYIGVQAIAQAKEEGLIVDLPPVGDPNRDAVIAENARIFRLIEEETIGGLGAVGAGGTDGDGLAEARRRLGIGN